MSVPSYSFHSLSLKLPNKEMSFSFPPNKLLNKGREEYSKMILFIHFHSIPFPPSKRSLNEFLIQNLINKFFKKVFLFSFMANSKKYPSKRFSSSICNVYINCIYIKLFYMQAFYVTIFPHV